MLAPTRDDRFSFGLWTVGWQARDTFGDATRDPLDPVEAVTRLSELGAYGVTLHDDDLIPFGSDDAERARRIKRFRDALDATGSSCRWSRPTSSPIRSSRTGPSRATIARCAATRSARVMRNLDLAAELGATTYVFWGGREGSDTDAAKDVRAALERFREALDLLAQFVIDRGYHIRFAIEPKPNEPRGDILLPTVGKRPRLHLDTRASGDGRAEPRGRA